MNFSEALNLIKDGKPVCREGWNGKGMYLLYVPRKGWALLFGDTTNIENAPWIGMKTADDKFVPWLASQTDILADDWMIAVPKID